MENKKLTPTPKGGGKKAAENFERDLVTEPSDRLVQIISEYEAPADEEAPEKEDDRAAKEAEL